jgi:arylsulfatase A-like enzyme
MTSRTGVFEEAGPAGSMSQDLAADRLGFFPLLALSAWCGLVSGLLEVGTTILRKQTYDLNHLYGMSRHFIWLIPLANLAIFLVVGMVLSVLVSCWRRHGRWVATRLLGALTLLPPIWATSTRLYGPAGFLLALGLAARLVPVLERHATPFRRLVRVSLPIVALLVPVLALSLWGEDRQKAWREEARPLPSAGSPNILLIVLDTVAAEHLSLHGYDRPTSPAIDEFASRGIRFDRVHATSSWTLLSHASMFTGRWPHELSANWVTPLDGAYPTVAEFLGSHGYATAGFIANTWYCASDSGLGRGFAAYQDYIFPRLCTFGSAVLLDRNVDGLEAVGEFLEDWLDLDLLTPANQYLWWIFKKNRKEAAVINREFLDWLSRRSKPERPFFAFLNYYDAHGPYEVPATGINRFRVKPRNRREMRLLEDWLTMTRKRLSQYQISFGRDCYDDCVANLDEQLGRLIDELDRRSVLERTWVIITSDHGESFGENPGVFWHGTSLYETQLHVPLVIIPPAGGPSPRVVTETVSLRDLAATIVDLPGFKAAAPFPGNSLARFWNGSAMASAKATASGRALSEVVPLPLSARDPSGWAHESRWPLAALTEGDWTYIRRDGEVREELFRVREDAQQRHNLANDPAMRPTLNRMRRALDELTAGPLTPKRFNP